MNWVVGIVQGMLIAVFLLAGGLGKLIKNDEMKTEFKHLGFKTSFMYFVGAAQVLGALGLLVGYWLPNLAVAAAAGLTLLMAGAPITHLRAGDGMRKAMPGLVIAILCAFVVWGRLSIA